MARSAQHEQGRTGIAWKLCAFLVAAVVVLLLARSAASAQPVYADPRRGHELAARLCATCHMVDREAGGPVTSDILSFRAMANQPGGSAVQMAGRIIIPHPAMPSVSLTAAEIRDIVAYIMSLKSN